MTENSDKTVRSSLSSKSRNVVSHHGKDVVSLRYDDEGKPLTASTLDSRKHIKYLDQNDWIFLECWQRHGYNAEKAAHELDLSDFNVKRLVKKLDCFRTEELRDRVIATVPSVEFLKARHVENLMAPKEEKLDDSDHKSLSELAKIQGAYKNTNQINIQNNVFQMPNLTPEQQAELKALGDRLASVDTTAEKVA